MTAAEEKSGSEFRLSQQQQHLYVQSERLEHIRGEPCKLAFYLKTPTDLHNRNHTAFNRRIWNKIAILSEILELEQQLFGLTS